MSLLILGFIILVLIVIVAFIILTILKKLLKLFMIVTIILSLILFSFGYLVYKDARDIRENFTNYNNLVLLKEDKILAGLIYNKNNLGFINHNAIIDLEGKMNDKKALLNGNYKVFILNLSVINDSGILEFEGKNFSKTYLIYLIKSNNPIYLANNKFNELDNTLMTQEEFKEKFEIKDDYEFKAVIFSALILDQVKKNPVYLIQEYKKNNIEVYPETIIFKLIKILPNYSLEIFKNLIS